MPASERVFWRTGALVFSGDDRNYLDGYQYAVTVAPDQFDALRRVLDAEPAADVIDLVCRHADAIMRRGERTWLDDQGIERGFYSY